MNGLRSITLFSLLLALIACGKADSGAYLAGDINGDNTVDHADALLAQRFNLELATPTPMQHRRGDINGDGRLDHADRLLIQRKALGL